MLTWPSKAWWVAGTAVVLIVAAIAAPRVVRRAPFFRVRMVEVVGTHYLDNVDVVAQLHLPSRMSIFDPLPRVSAAARAIPGVDSATVTRRLPGTLRVTLREAAPVAMVPINQRLVLIDYRAHVLPFDPARFPTSLPLSSRDAATAGLLGQLRVTDPDLYGSVELARRDSGDVILDIGAQQIRLRPDADADVLRSVRAVRRYLDQHHIGWSELDARYDQRVFVRRGTA